MSCSTDNDSSSDTDYDFYSYTDFNEWYQDHTWAVGVDVLSGSSKDVFMTIEPYLNCYRQGIVNTSDEFLLTINEAEIPLAFVQGSVVVNNSGPDINIDFAEELHIIFKINGRDKINKTVAVPFSLNLNTPDNLDFTNPVVLTWTLQKNADYLETEVNIRCNMGAAYSWRLFKNLIRPHLREYTLPSDYYLDYFNYTNPAGLVLRNATLYAMNFEEQYDNVIAVKLWDTITLVKD